MTRGPGRWAVRLLIVVVVIAAIVGLGYLWRASSLASIITDGGREHRPHNGDGGDRFDRFRNDGAFSLGNIDELVQTVFIGVAVLAGVVIIDRVRRARRPVNPSQR